MIHIDGIKLNDLQSREHWLPCGQCKNETCHTIATSIDIKAMDFWNLVEFEESYQIVQCQGCKVFSFRKTHTEYEEIKSERTKTTHNVPRTRQELYPSRVAGRHKLSQQHLLPAQVATIYDETHTALCNKQPVLAGIGIRALVETVCKEKAAQGGSLEKKIDSLISLGILTNDGAEILHSLRILGNEAAHEVKPHLEQTLGAAMDVVEHLLKTVYVLPAIASRLPRRTSQGTP
jgi:hypothetical protein